MLEQSINHICLVLLACNQLDWALDYTQQSRAISMDLLESGKRAFVMLYKLLD